MGEEGLTQLVILLREHMKKIGIPMNVGRNTKIKFPASAYVSGYIPPTLDAMTSDSNVFIKKSNFRMSQRIVAKRRFYQSTVPRLDSVMVEGHDEESSPTPHGHMRIWFAQGLAFMRIQIGPECSSQCRDHRRIQCPVCNPQLEQELIFLQYYDVLSNEALKVDGIDKSLNCIRLRWQRTEGDFGKSTSGKQYGLSPIDSIRGMVHVVSADMAISKLATSVNRRKEYDRLRCDEDEWPSNIYYVNRFYRRKCEEYEYVP